MWTALKALAPDEVALAASKAHAGARPADRIAELLMLVGDLAMTYPKLTMWQQGLLGEACVIQGAHRLRERHRLARQVRPAEPQDPVPLPRATDTPERSLSLSVTSGRVRVQAAARACPRQAQRVVAACLSPTPTAAHPAGVDLLGDARWHSTVTRARELTLLTATPATQWRWNHLAQRLTVGIDLADRLNALAPSSSGMPQPRHD